MSSVFKKPKVPKDDGKKLIEQQLADETRRRESLEMQQISSRRARLGGGAGVRSGLAYTPPAGGPASNLGG